eukprot:SAG22_NODE_555_length_9124_cov_114.706593_4_plen_420_part_00
MSRYPALHDIVPNETSFCSVGIVDYAFDAKPGVTALALKSFVGDMVLLATGPKGIVVYPEDMVATQPLPPAFTSNETLAATIKLSNFGLDYVAADHVRWSVGVNGRTVCAGAGPAGVTLEQGAVTTVDIITCKLPDLGSFPSKVPGADALAPHQVELSARLLSTDGTTVLTNNSWHSRLYPLFNDSPAPAPLYTTAGTPAGTAMLQQCMFDNAGTLPHNAAGVGADAVVLTDSLSDDVLAALANNATVVLVATPGGAGRQMIPTAGNTFPSCWWLCRGNVGTVVYPRGGLLAGMDGAGYADGTWQRMIDGSVAFVMENANRTVHEALGDALSYDSSYAWHPSRSNATVHVRALPDILGGPRSSALLFELGAKGGKGGRLIATGLNIWPGEPNASSWPGGYGHPEKAYLLWKLLDAGFRG